MILVVGIVLGLVAGTIRTWVHRQPYQWPDIQRVELALISFLPQAFVFFVPQTGRFASPQVAALILPLSLGILVLFVWFNRNLPGFWLLGLGLLLNLVVIAANGGLMPISPETMAVLYDTPSTEEFADLTIGTKSIVLPASETRLEWLADRFTVPDRSPIQFAYSLGDVFLVAGAFWALWAGGAARPKATSARLERQPF